VPCTALDTGQTIQFRPMFVLHFCAVFLSRVQSLYRESQIEQCSNRRRNLVPDESGPRFAWHTRTSFWSLYHGYNVLWPTFGDIGRMLIMHASGAICWWNSAIPFTNYTWFVLHDVRCYLRRQNCKCNCNYGTHNAPTTKPMVHYKIKQQCSQQVETKTITKCTLSWKGKV